ncbi:uncharacterized protein LOC106674054 [Cimex lectularius]|uniref:MADF domain-containing protein n=1 Tax=Cimex lectularius TaxID=79782 RepID=A0A8I6THX2_CIMLE|nr:uncharacterized protein LOC106674054 [Cimex lectularius]
MCEVLEIDNDILISLVEARPVLWDKTLNSFKDRNLTQDAWREVCCALRNDFEDMEDKEKNAFGKEVTKRWGNLRDAFSKSKRKLKESKKSGAGARTFKNYVYAEQMQFLNKLFQTREVVDSLDGGTENNEDENVDALPGATVPPKENPKPRENKRRRQPDEVEMKIIKALEEPPLSPHILFFQGLLPHLNKFDDSEVLEFQMGVLEVISKIKNKQKNTAQPQLLPRGTPFYYPSNYPFPQHQSFPPSQMSYSNQFSFKPQEPQTYQSHQFKYPLSHNYDSNQQQACSSKGKAVKHPQGQTTAQYLAHEEFGRTSPETFPSASPSPAGSDTTYDFS